MKLNQKRLLLTLGIGLILIVGFFLITEAITKFTGFSVSPTDDDNDFEICLEEQDITLYINTADTAATLRKLELIAYLDKISIINCFRDNSQCLENNVVSFPSWKINNEIIGRDITLTELTEYSGCKVIN